MKKTIAFLLYLILTATSCVLFPLPAKAEPHTIIVPNDYLTVQGAIDNANAGDTILVKSGTYDEQALEINKSLTITSESPYQAKLDFHPPTYLQTVGISRHFNITTMIFNDSISIKADNVKLSGFVITNKQPMNANLNSGFISANGNKIQITNNIIGDQEILFSLDLTGNENQAINNTVATLSIDGSNQTAAYNDVRGTVVSGSFNYIAKNSAGLLTLAGSNNIVVDNSFTADRGGGYIRLIGADHNTFTNNTVVCDWQAGIAIGYATPQGGSYNVFAGNKVEGATSWGILVAIGSYNVFYGNLIANNWESGLALGGNNDTENNLFFGNVFMNNSKNFGANWNLTGYNSFDDGTIGNYWEDYLTKYPSASEIGFSGIGDTPYLVYGNTMDHHPLMNKLDVSVAIPALPSPWSTLLTQLPPSTPDTLKLLSLIILTLFAIVSLSIAAVLILRKRKNAR